MDKEFVKGLFYNMPNQSAPEYVVGEISIRVDEFMQWVEKNAHLQSKGYLPITIKRSKSGTYYAEVNMFKLGKHSGYKPKQPDWTEEDKPAEEPPEDDGFPF